MLDRRTLLMGLVLPALARGRTLAAPMSGVTAYAFTFNGLDAAKCSSRKRDHLEFQKGPEEMERGQYPKTSVHGRNSRRRLTAELG